MYESKAFGNGLNLERGLLYKHSCTNLELEIFTTMELELLFQALISSSKHFAIGNISTSVDASFPELFDCLWKCQKIMLYHYRNGA